MSSYIARQAIFDSSEQVVCYDLIFRGNLKSAFPTTDKDQATSTLITEAHLVQGIESISGALPSVINFTEDALLDGFATVFQPNLVIIEISSCCNINNETIEACRKLYKAGYQLAIEDYDFDAEWDLILPYISIVNINVKGANLIKISQQARRIKGSGIKLCAEKVDKKEVFEQLKLLGFDLFQGFFFTKPEPLKPQPLPLNKQNLIALIRHISDDPLDLDGITKIIQKDLSLSFKLLRFINSVGSGSSEKIGSLKHALAFLGETELKKFIAVLALAGLNQGKTEALCVLSLIRAKFCELIALDREDPNNPPSAFLTGMFSLVDAILDSPMDKIATQLPILEEIQLALIYQNGHLGRYLKLAHYYEQANWQQVDELSTQLSLNQADLASFYQTASQWVNALQKTGELS